MVEKLMILIITEHPPFVGHFPWFPPWTSIATTLGSRVKYGKISRSIPCQSSAKELANLAGSRKALGFTLPGFVQTSEDSSFI